MAILSKFIFAIIKLILLRYSFLSARKTPDSSHVLSREYALKSS